jgi:GMP synthase (glutamine-hydrolysing)
LADHQLVLILDFGSQYTQLIARRIRELEVYCEICRPDLPADEIRRRAPIGIVLSGGPMSVDAEGAPLPDAGLFDLGIPIIGLCYGMQLTAKLLGGRVGRGRRREYGRAEIEIGAAGPLFAGLPPRQTVWMSHGDHVELLPPGFRVTATSEHLPAAAFESTERRIWGCQFHPEVVHTESGREILRNFLTRICGATGDWSVRTFRKEAIEAIRAAAGDDRVILGLSGGVDSSVVALLLREAIGSRATPIFVDNGVLRKNEGAEVAARFAAFGLEIDVVDASDRFLANLAGHEEPEKKRKIIGATFIDVFEKEAKRFRDARCLAQGTLYPDVIESTSVKGPSAVIKTHHNVGGLPEKLGFRLIEPLRMLFKDEVRALGRELGLPADLVGRHPFPGPGLAVRILGEVTRERTALLREADAIFLEELRAAGLYEKTSQAFAVLLPVRSVGVMGDERTYEHVCALRSVDTVDFMTADWSRLPAELLDRTARRIVNEVRGINRVVYDITSKPPATIEWE